MEKNLKAKVSVRNGLGVAAEGLAYNIGPEPDSQPREATLSLR
jgi:hypothetical protein